MRPWSVAAAVAERQHLALASWQLRWLGVSAGAVADRVHGHGWSRPYTGVLFLPGPDTPLRRLSGAVLAYARPTRAAPGWPSWSAAGRPPRTPW